MSTVVRVSTHIYGVSKEIDGKMFIFRVNLGMWPLKSIVLEKWPKTWTLNLQLLHNTKRPTKWSGHMKMIDPPRELLHKCNTMLPSILLVSFSNQYWTNILSNRIFSSITNTFNLNSINSSMSLIYFCILADYLPDIVSTTSVTHFSLWMSILKMHPNKLYLNQKILGFELCKISLNRTLDLHRQAFNHCYGLHQV